MFKVITKFADMLDNNHIYEIGDVYPREGVETSEQRINELATNINRIGHPVIEEVKEEKPKKKTSRK